jgi:putative transposase
LDVLDARKTAAVDDRIRRAAQTIYQALIEAELTSVIGAGPHERSPDRLVHRNGHRARVLTGQHPQGRRPGPGLGADSGISKSEVSRICADLDSEVSAFRDRSLAGQRFPYILVDATYCKAMSTSSWT